MTEGQIQLLIDSAIGMVPMFTSLLEANIIVVMIIVTTFVAIGFFRYIIRRLFESATF